MKIAKPLAKVVESFEKLPGIGPKSAQRLAYYLLHVPQSQLEEFAKSLEFLRKDTVFCGVCKNVSETDPCPICSDPNRNKKIIMVVEQPLDILAIERTGNYSGVYHVLHGAISPLDNIGPDELYIADLMNRIGTNGDGPNEVIVATNPTMEGDATAMFLSKEIKAKNSLVKVSRLGMGIPTGADLEYADETTLTKAIEGRTDY